MLHLDFFRDSSSKLNIGSFLCTFKPTKETRLKSKKESVNNSHVWDQRIWNRDLENRDLIIPSFEDIANLTMENNSGICRLQILDLYPVKIGVI